MPVRPFEPLRLALELRSARLEQDRPKAMSRYLASLRIGQKLFIVGGVPILVAGIIAAVAWILLLEAERARNGAVIASENYHTFTLLNKARDEYIVDIANSRKTAEDSFNRLSETAAGQLGELKRLARTEGQRGAVETVDGNLNVLLDQMKRLVRLEGELGDQVAGLSRRASALIDLTDFARKRQQADNAGLIAVLKTKDAELERNQRVVTALGAFRDAISAIELNKARIGQPVFKIEFDELDSDLKQLDASGRTLAAALETDGQARDARDLDALSKSYWERSRTNRLPAAPVSEGFELIRTTQPSHALVEWSNRLIKQSVFQQQALHYEVANLIKGSVSSNEGELVAQNIALATLRLAQQTGAALTHRNAGEARTLLRESLTISENTRTLPVLHSIKDEMGTAIDGWRAQLSATIDKVEAQNELIRGMDRLAAGIGQNARALSNAFIADANRLGGVIRQLLLFGAVGALLLGIGAAIAVARSITRPLHRLQHNMLVAAGDFGQGRITDDGRRDELGDIARTANVFLAEIARRENGWRQAARRADEALANLRQAQDDLIRSEKLASLGQLVAGVSHEISTPLGIALTTATQMQADGERFERFVAAEQISRARLREHSARIGEGVKILSGNLLRATDLLSGFKQLAVDQAREDRRVVELGSWLGELLRSLSTLIRSGKHDLSVTVQPDLTIDTYPGVLAQVLSNLVKNTVDHGLRDRTGGRIEVGARVERDDEVCITIRDDGVGIPTGDLTRVFDPFFTTARSRGGTGLGLHIVHNLVVNKLHGRVELRSDAGAGTVVRIWLPRHLPAPAAPLPIGRS